MMLTGGEEITEINKSNFNLQMYQNFVCQRMKSLIYASSTFVERNMGIPEDWKNLGSNRPYKFLFIDEMRII